MLFGLYRINCATQILYPQLGRFSGDGAGRSRILDTPPTPGQVRLSFRHCWSDFSGRGGFYAVPYKTVQVNFAS